MKRTLLLLLLSVAVFGGAYFIASVVIPDPPMSMANRDESVTLSPPKATLSGEGVGPSEGLSFRLFDPKTNQPVAQVNVGTYRRTGERTVSLADVTVDVLIEGGAAARIYSPSGTVRVEPPTEGTESQIDADALTAADQARLSDVTLRWYANARDLASNRRPTMTASVDNLVFDHTRFTLATSDTTIDGRTVLADDVPVVVEGADYDFFGFGLRVEWDPNEQRPALIRVARGDRLIIKNPPAFVEDSSASRPVPLQFAALDDEAIAAAISAQDEPAEITPYEITLSDSVTVEQKGQTLLEADEAAAIVAMAKDAGLRAAPADLPPAPAKPAPRPASAPTTSPRPAGEKFEPMTVRWNGPLLVRPADDDQALLGEGDMRLYLEGAPLIGRFGGSELRGQTLDYHRAADRLIVTAAPGEDVILADVDGNKLVTPKLVATPDAGSAQAVGAGYADLLDAEDDGQRTQMRWLETCDFTFERPLGEDGEPGDAVLRSVDAAGGVTVESRQLRLRGDTLALTLDAPAGSSDPPQLKSVTAAGSVRCLVEQTDGTIASFESGDLLLTFPQGIDGSVELRAGGGVVTRQPEGELSGERMTASLAHNDDGELEITSLQVEDNVIAFDANARAVRGALATLDGPDRPLVVTGTDVEPATLIANVGGAKSTIQSLTIVLDPADESLGVPGPGQLDSSQTPESGDAALQRIVEWQGSFIATNARVDIEGDVQLGGDLDEATVFAMSVQTIAVTLREPPEGDEDPLAGVDRVEAEGEVRLTVQTFGVDETVTRSIDLRAPKLSAIPATREFLVPEPGQVLFRDLRPSIATTPTDQGGDEATGSFRGDVALGWDDQLHYLPADNRLTITGRATAAVAPREGSAFKLVADTITADVIQPADETASPDVRRVMAEGTVVFNAVGLNLEAGIAIYDPATGLLTTRGTAGGSVQLFDDRGVRTGQFAEVIYDVVNGRIDRATELRVGG